MSPRSSSQRKSFLFYLLATALCVGLLFTQYQQQRETQQIRLARFMEKLHKLLPMMRESALYENLATEKLLTLTQDVSSFDEQTIPDLARNLQECFGNQLHLAIRDHQGVLSHSFGFTEPEKGHVSNILMFLQHAHSGTQNPLSRDFYDDAIKGLFSKSIRASNLLWNSVCIKRAEFQQQPGLACFISRVSNSGINPYFYQYLPSAYQCPKSICTGQMMAFISFNALSKEWRNRHLLSSSLVSQAKRGLIFELPAPGILPTSEIVFDSLPAQSPLSDSFLHEVTRTLSHSPQTVILQDGLAVCAVRTFEPSPQVFMLLFDIPSEPLSPVLLAFTITLLIAWITTLLVWTRVSGFLPVWNQPLPAKFSRVMLAILLFPLGGMLAMFLNRTNLEEDSRRILLETQLEEGLLGLENRAELFVYQRLFNIFRDISDKSWATPPTASAVVDFFQGHQQQGLEELYILHRDFPRLLSPKAKPGKGALSIYRMVSLLFSQFQENTGLYVNRQQQTESSDDLQGRFLMEGMQDMFGGDSLYRIALYQNHLLPFSLFEDLTWISFRTLYDTLHQPLVGFMITLNRKDMQRQIVGQWVLENAPDPGAIPSLHFVHLTEQAGLHFMPEYAAGQPALRSILAHVARSGGTHHSVVSIEGKEYLCVSRRMRFIDYAVLSLEPLAHDPATDSPQTFWLFTTLFPLLGLYLARSRFQRIYLEPILAIEQSVHELARGNTDAPFPQQSGDEIAFLGQAFSRMATSLREKEFLQRFLSDFTLDLVRHPSQIRASRLQATILFADIRGFTTLSENCPAPELVTMLNEYFTRMETVIESQGGSIDKFIGDAIMAVFLPQIGREHPAIRAMKAGLHMQEEVGRFSRERESGGLFPIRIGVGLGTGEVLLGLVGNESGRQDFAVTGPTVSLSAAMEKRSKEGVSSRVIVCSETSSHLPASVSLHPLPPAADLPAGFEIQV